MSPSDANTQPVRAVQSRPGCLKRIVQLLFLAIIAVGIFVFGYATGTGLEILVPANALIETAIASFPDLADALSTRSPLPTFTPQPADTHVSVPTDAYTPVKTDTPIPTATEPPPTRTPIPTATQPLPTFTPNRPACYHHEEAWVTGEMNVREQPSTNAQKVGSALAGESFTVLESRRGDTYCWLRINNGWMAQTALVSATKPQVRVPSSASGGVQQALNTLNALVVAPEHRCSPYDSDSYPYSQSVEAQIVARMGGRIYGHYTGQQHRRNGHRTHCGEIRSPR